MDLPMNGDVLFKKHRILIIKSKKNSNRSKQEHKILDILRL